MVPPRGTSITWMALERACRAVGPACWVRGEFPRTTARRAFWGQHVWCSGCGGDGTGWSGKGGGEGGWEGRLKNQEALGKGKAGGLEVAANGVMGTGMGSRRMDCVMRIGRSAPRTCRRGVGATGYFLALQSIVAECRAYARVL